MPGMNPRRADIIVAGNAVLIGALALLGRDELVVCERALRDGVVVDLAQRDRELAQRLGDERAERIEAVEAVARRYEHLGGHQRHVARLALVLFERLAPLHGLAPGDRDLLWAAAVLHGIGRFVADSGHHKHAAYLIRNTPLKGWTDDERELIAQIARYYRKAMPKPSHLEYVALASADRRRVDVLASLLRIADGFDILHLGTVGRRLGDAGGRPGRDRRAGRRRRIGRSRCRDGESRPVRAHLRRAARLRGPGGRRMTTAIATKKKILLVDDEAAIVHSLRYNLEKNGYAVATAGDGRTAVKLAQSEHPDLIVLDIMLPLLDGIEACKEIRKSSSVPIIMLTAKDQEFDKVLALELGADDYVTKPFSLGEIMARIKARLRRAEVDADERDESITAGEITIDPSRQRLVVRGRDVALAPKEFRLLHVLMENRGRIVTRQMLLEKVWGYDFEGEHQTISVHVRWLREKIEVDPNNPRHIITVRSRGYLFRE